MLNRRRFVYGMVSAGVLGPGFLGSATAAQRASLPSLQGRLSRDVFLALRQQTFSAVIDDRRVRLVLVEVSDDGCCPGREQFTVRFQGPRDLRLKDGTCVLSHPSAGSAPLYVQAAGTDGRSGYVKAPFNLLS
jgi:uncharacterized protein DUF6916